MKKLISVLMILSMMLCLVPAAYAESPVRMDYTDDYDVDDEFYSDYMNNLYLLLESMRRKQKDPVYFCFYDVNSDGLYELFIDKDNGKKAVEITDNCMAAKRSGDRFFLSKGNCDMYYWDFQRDSLTYFPIVNGYMFLSVWPEARCAVGCGFSGSYYESYGFYDPDARSNEYLSVSYIKSKTGEATYIGGNGTFEGDIEGAEMSILEMLACSHPLVFTTYEFY